MKFEREIEILNSIESFGSGNISVWTHNKAEYFYFRGSASEVVHNMLKIAGSIKAEDIRHYRLKKGDRFIVETADGITLLNLEKFIMWEEV